MQVTGQNDFESFILFFIRLEEEEPYQKALKIEKNTHRTFTVISFIFLYVKIISILWLRFTKSQIYPWSLVVLLLNPPINNGKERTVSLQ